MSDVKISVTKGGTRLTAVTSDGQYVGSLDIDAVNPQALAVLANALQQFANAQSPGIQIAGAAALNGLNGKAVHS